MLVLVVWMEVGVVVSGAVGPAVAAVHRAVHQVDAAVRVLLLRGPLRRPAYVQDFGVVPFPGLALSQLPGLCLDPDGEEDTFNRHWQVILGNEAKFSNQFYFVICFRGFRRQHN